MSIERIPIITLWQPWATWIALGWKTIETRTHPRFRGLMGKRIGIHAGAHWDQDAFDTAEQYLSDEQLLQTKEYYRLRKGIVCTAMVQDFRKLTVADSTAALIECRSTRWGLVLADVLVPEVPVPANGRQGIWFYPTEGKWTSIAQVA